MAHNIYVHTSRDIEHLVSDAARRFVELVMQTPVESSRFRVALSGGHTPKQFYQALVRDYAKAVDWTRVDFFWSDERFVPSNHVDSNFRLAHENLLKPLGLAETQIFRVATEGQSAHQAAGAYESTITSVLGAVPRFDLILLGLGDDGHTASLFPGSTALIVTNKWVVANWVQKLQSWRITFTYPLLNHSKNIIFLAGGDKKACVLAEIFAGAAYPAALVKPIHGQIDWFVDDAAARLLK
jgi:6-phosphogluconolactonase